MSISNALNWIKSSDLEHSKEFCFLEDLSLNYRV